MNISRRWFTKLSTALVLLMLGAAWIAFAPLQFGGQVAYVIVNGNSMEPLYHRGDLVIIRAQSDYQIGDIVTYRHPQIGPVIHRIIGRDVAQFVFKGDHNNFIDPYHPTRSELIGRSWMYLPSVGTVLSQLRTPLNLAILAAVAGVSIMAPSISGANQTTTRKGGRRQPAQPRPGSNNEWLLTALMALVVLACAALALAAFAFMRPPMHEVTDELTYQHTGVFSYSASAPDGVYDSATIQTGEPLFLQLTSAATFRFDYQLEADQPTDLHGTYRLVAEVSAANGWRRTIELQPATAFSGGAFTASGVLALAKVQALISRFEQQTGLDRQQYTLAIMPEVLVNGTLAGHALTDEYAPRLEFRLDQLQMQLVDSSGGQNLLKPSKPGLLKYTHVEPNVITLLFFNLAVPTARGIALGMLALALLGLLGLGLLLLRIGQPDEAARIRSKYAALLIDMTAGDQQPGVHVVELPSINDLAKLAEKGGHMILHERSGSRDRYVVHDNGMCYQFASTDRNPPPQQLPAVVAAPGMAAWHGIFLDTLREKGTISEACRMANVEIAAAYEERTRVPAFAQAWTEARATLRESLSQKADLL